MARKLSSNLGMNLASTPDPSPLDVVLDSWDRKNAILLNRLRAIPQGELESRAVSGSPCVAEMFTLIAYVRLIFVSDDAPRFAGGVPENDWLFEAEPERIAQVMDESAAAVRDAVQNAVEKGDEMRIHHGHPSSAATHDLARGLSSRSDQVSPEARGLSDRGQGNRAGYLGRVDAKKR